MADFDRQHTVAMREQRCYACGRWWAAEINGPDGICPVCAQARINRAIDAQQAAERTARSLRGALTRRKAKR